jgi:hypothetical protein
VQFNLFASLFRGSKSNINHTVQASSSLYQQELSAQCSKYWYSRQGRTAAATQSGDRFADAAVIISDGLDFCAQMQRRSVSRREGYTTFKPGVHSTTSISSRNYVP